MNEPNKPFKKCTAYYLLKDHTINPPKIIEGIRSETTYNEEEDLMEFKKYDNEGKLKRVEIMYDDKTQITEYDENGISISDELIEYEKNEAGDNETISSDLDGNVNEERLEYDEKGRVAKKLFIENGKVTSHIEFEYDDKGREVKTKGYEKGKLDFIHEDIYEKDICVITNEYSGKGNLKVKSILEITNEGLTNSQSRFDKSDKLIERVEEDRDEEDHILEQRVYDENNKLKLKTIFGEDDEFGYRTSLEEHKFENGKLVKEVVTRYKYEY